MAEQFIEDIYWYADIEYKMEKIVESIRLCLDLKAVDMLNLVFPRLCELCNRRIEDNLESGRTLWSAVKDITLINGDLLAIGDKIELEILPRVREYVRSLADIDVDLDERYSIKSTETGYLTLYNKDRDIYLHSRNNPMLEAMKYVQSVYDGTKSIYYVYGCGMGYMLYQLFEQADGYTKIVLYEPDDIVYESAILYGVLSRIPRSFIERRDFKEPDSFFQNAEKDGAGVMIHVPSMHVIQDPEWKRGISTYWMWQNTDRMFGKEIRNNRFRNSELKCENAQVFVDCERCNEAVVVAAGPSLARNIDMLKKSMGTRKIVAVSHAFKKILKEGITPDCVVMIDPQDNMIYQLPEGDCNVPLLLDEDVYWKVAREYKGPKYLMRKWDYSGTVSSAALEIAVRSGASKVYLVGLDLGYPDMKSHAEGIEDSADVDKATLFPVESENGGEVLTDRNLDYYRKIIEGQIEKYHNVKFYNMSMNGARIKGTLKTNELNMVKTNRR